MAKRGISEPLREEEKRRLNKTSFKHLSDIFRYMMPYKGIFIVGLIALFFSSVILMAFPRLAGELLDTASGKPKYFTTIGQTALALFAILFVVGVFSFIRVYTFAIVVERGMASLRKDLYQKIVTLPITFFDTKRTGDLMSRLTSDISVLQEGFGFTLAELLRQSLTFLTGVAIIVYLAPTLTAFMLLTFPVLVIAAMIFGKFIRKLSKKTQDKLAVANVIVEESLQSISVVKAFTNEKFETTRYSNVIQDVVSIAIRSAKYRGLFISFIIFAIFSGIVGVAWYGAYLVQTEDITTGELFSFVLYTSLIGFSIAGLGDIYAQLQRAVGAAERILDVLGERNENVQHDAPPLKLHGDIEFNHVSFAYPTRGEYTVLKDLNFQIKPGEKVALVGQSGSGKSTIINLLLRFYPVMQGTIRVDGQDIQQLDLSAYRQNLGIVPQEIILFGGTIFENIAYGKPGATFEEVREAARLANALEFIESESCPEKFDTLVGERGVKLSGGQRQRIAIARAILKDPVVLILDEATSSLDTHSEMLVQQALEKLMEGRTSIIIAHRLSTIKKADRIFVIQNGRLAETGSHSELTQLENGIYSNLLKPQLQ